MSKLKMSQVLEDADQSLQIVGRYLTNWNGKKMKAEGYCAVGLLSCASKNVFANGLFKEGEYMFLKKLYGVSSYHLTKRRKCPHCDTTLGGIAPMIIHLNDRHVYTYKSIAKYLRRLKL